MAASVPSETATSTIVLVGAFNPAILQPRWLASAEALPEGEADATEGAGNIILSREITVAQFRSYALEATPERFSLTTTPETETPSLLRDAVVNIFTLLTHSPIKLVGMNHARHIELSDGAWPTLRERLAPSAAWEEIVDHPELSSLSTTAARPDDLKGWVRVTVEPSARVAGGLWVAINDHVDLGEDTTDAKRAVEVLDEHWDPSLTRSEELMERISSGL